MKFWKIKNYGSAEDGKEEIENTKKVFGSENAKRMLRGAAEFPKRLRNFKDKG